MTANKGLKKLIRNRMRKTGESYTAARRHFLHSQEASMTTRYAGQDRSELNLSVDRLQLTLRTKRVLKQHDIKTIRQLVGTTENELADIGLAVQGRIEIRDVLASRGM
jgi:DNA-directed RNA polymerase alpha subunit